ncbi:hypothetical protein PAXRUDRAFT_10339 [Paxillus rubicundulus Ve08.2h10]|uniref:Uncharacterized protein n=1 Tax=Paxillus rubicundulus Ve08.2h10 TaxID=930991 RepID=A0A0D0EB54_9AGAM|nr:hypothetical protein PAXRUDRAFT_10339 [Paxillus rubicundulus Ve08.2h10]
MSSSITNDLTKWSDEQLHKNEDDNDNLYKKKSAEHRRLRKEAEHWVAEEVAKWKAEEVAKRKAEVEAQRRAEAEAKVRAEEVARVQSLVSGPFKGKQPKAAASRAVEVREQVGGLAPCYGCSGAGVSCEMRTARGSKARLCNHCRRLKHKCERPGDTQQTQQRKQEELMSPWAGKKKAWMQSPVVDKDDDDEYKEEAGEEHDMLGTLTEVLAAVVTEMRDMATDRRRAVAESHAQTEWMLGILEEIQGCLDPEFTPEEPEVGSEEDFKEEEVAEAAEEREALKGWSEEEAEVDESM